MTAGVVFQPGAVQLLVMGPKGARGAERAVDPALEGSARRVALSAALRNLASELELRPGSVVHVAVPRGEALVRRVTAPPVPEEELAPIVALQARRDLPFEPDEVQLAWVRSEVPNELIYAAVKKTALEELRAAILGAGLVPGRLEVSSQALARAARLLGPGPKSGASSGWRAASLPPERETVLVLVEPRQFEAVVLAQGRAPFARGATLPEEGWTERLGAELVRTLGTARAERGQDPAGPPERVLVAGSAAGEAGLLAALGARLGCEAQVLSGLDGDPQGARYVLTRGLAEPRHVRGLDPLDLGHHARSSARADLKRRAVLSGLGVAALLGLLLLGSQLVLSQRRGEIERLEAERASMQTRVKEAKRLEAELQKADAWAERRGRELEVLLLVANALPKDDAYLTQLRWTEGGELRVTGRAREWEAVGAFFSALERDPRVERAAYDDIRRPAEKDALGVQFSGSARLRGEREGTP